MLPSLINTDDMSQNASDVDKDCGNSEGVTWTVGPDDAEEDWAWRKTGRGKLMWPCHVRGVVRLAPKPFHDGVVIRLQITQTRGWSLTIADSASAIGNGKLEIYKITRNCIYHEE